MAPRDDGYRPPPQLGTAAFGDDHKGRPTGAVAFGGPDADDPLRGALLFGNDPQGAPTGAESFGGPDAKTPLRGALLFGNDPQGAPTGAESFGGPEPLHPLKGALRFGNDPRGAGTGSEAFGRPDERFGYRGSEAFGAPQLVPDRLDKDELGYDFVGVLLATDDASLAGVRKDPRNRGRERVLRLLERTLGMTGERLRHGLGEDAVPWGRLKRESGLDRALAELLREGYRKASGSVLGIAQVTTLLERAERMHTLELRCDWDKSPVRLDVHAHAELVARGVTALHNEHRFFVFEDAGGRRAAYVDCIVPHRRQRARVRSPKGETVAAFELGEPGPGGRFAGKLVDRRGRVVAELREERAAAKHFRAALVLPGCDEVVGTVDDALEGGRIRARVEIDLRMPRTVAWGVGAVLADVARLRRAGWPEAPEEPAREEKIESVEEALGPRRRR